MLLSHGTSCLRARDISTQHLPGINGNQGSATFQSLTEELVENLFFVTAYDWMLFPMSGSEATA
jgi:hypothetical protein